MSMLFREVTRDLSWEEQENIVCKEQKNKCSLLIAICVIAFGNRDVSNII